jgi:hypothetical protein
LLVRRQGSGTFLARLPERGEQPGPVGIKLGSGVAQLGRLDTYTSIAERLGLKADSDHLRVETARTTLPLTAPAAVTTASAPAAIGPLNGLLQKETDRKVPRHLIEQAIEACATNSAPVSAPAAIPSAPPPAIDSDREVIEI